MKSYPLTKCYSPRIIQNKYTGEMVEVGCGVCKACLSRRANKMSLLCSVEEAEHKYGMFVTLTYDPQFAPLMWPTLDEKNGVVRWYSSCDRLGDKGQLMAVDYQSNHTEHKYLRGYLGLLRGKTDPKGELHGAMVYVSKREIQLFLKRLRKQLKRYTDEKIRYYAVGEYGPTTFRGHYHLELFYDKEETQHYIRRCIRSAWSVEVGRKWHTDSQGCRRLISARRSLGRVDMSLSRGKVTSYIAKYINSNHFIPPFLGSVSVKPFTLHSWFLAQGIYRRHRKEIYADDPSDFVQLGGELAGKYVEFMPWRSLACTFFPKCKGYSCKSDSELWKSYNILRDVKALFGSSFERLTLPQIAYNLLDRVVNYKFSRVTTGRRPVYDELTKSVCEFFSDGMVHNPYVVNHYSDDDAKYFTNSILSQLYISRHFLTFVCDNDSYRERRRKLDIIKRFWQQYDYRLLIQMYQSQVENASVMSDFSWYYVNKMPCKYIDHVRYVDMSLLSKERFYQEFVIESDANFEKSIKHKRQNDANLIFCR